MKIYLLLLFLFITNVFSQPLFQHYNLDFEIGSSKNIPVGWRLSKDAKLGGFEFSPNTLDAISGNQSGVIYNYSANSDKTGTAFQSVDATPYRNKKIRISAFLKLESQVVKSFGQFFVHEYIGDKSSKYDDLNGKKITNKLWEMNSIEMEISPLASKVNFGFTLFGNGALSADNFKIEIINDQDQEILSGNSIDKNKTKVLNEIGKTWGNLRYFMPSDQAQIVNHESVLIKMVSETLKNPNNYKAILKDNLEPIFPAYFTNNIKPQNPLADNYIVYKHIGAPNFGTPSFSSTEVKNIYFTDRPREAAAFQKFDVLENDEAKFEVSCKIKVKQKNSTGNAQIWLKFDKTQGNDERITNFDNKIIKNEWTDYTIEGQFPKNVKRMTIGLVALGELDAYFDELKVRVFPKEGEPFLLIPNNNSFEDEDKDGKPKDWEIAYSVFGVGYDVTISNEESTKGNHSLKMSSDDSRQFTYPAPDTKIGTIKIPSGLYLTSEGTYPTTDFKFKDQKINFNLKDDASKITLAIDAITHHDLFTESKEKLFDNIMKLETIFNQFVNANNYIDLEFAIAEIFSDIDDSQFRVWHLNDNIYSLPFSIEKFTDGYFVNAINNDQQKVQIGDQIIEINGQAIENYINDFTKYHSSPNNEFSINRALINITTGKKGEKVNIKFKDGTEKDFEKKYRVESIKGEPSELSFELRKGVFYINASMIDDKYLKEIMKEYGSDTKAIIIEARGNVLLSEYFLGYFVDSEINGLINKIPVYTSPEHLSYKKLQPFIPPLNLPNKPKLIFLVDENTSSYGESIVALAKYYGIGTIIGEPTSGTPGDTSPVRLIGGFNYTKNVNLAFYPDGKLINGNPIQPDILQKSTSKSMRPDLDELVEKALEVLGE
jgi:hypothetical protein